MDNVSLVLEAMRSGVFPCELLSEKALRPNKQYRVLQLLLVTPTKEWTLLLKTSRTLVAGYKGINLNLSGSSIPVV